MRRVLGYFMPLVVVGCGAGSYPTVPPTTASPTAAPTSVVTPSPAAAPTHFPAELFAALGHEPVADQLAAELQEVLDASADGAGLTATLITADGIWSGATGMASAERPMVAEDQIAIYSITKTIVAAQVMRLVETGELSLEDLAADRLPADLEFDTNGARLVDLLSMRSGLPQWVVDDAAMANDALHVWTAQEKLATVPPERGPVGQNWEYSGTNYLLLGLVIEHVTGRSVAQVMRSGVLAGDAYERLIYQPDERPTDPWSITEELGLSAETFDEAGGYLPSLSVVTMFANDGNMASDSMSVAEWFRELCAAELVTQASLDAVTDFVARPGYGLGVIDRSAEYWPGSGAFGHKGGNHTVALCFQDPVSVVVVLGNVEHDVDTLAGELVRAART